MSVVSPLVFAGVVGLLLLRGLENRGVLRGWVGLGVRGEWDFGSLGVCCLGWAFGLKFFFKPRRLPRQDGALGGRVRAAFRAIAQW